MLKLDYFDLISPEPIVIDRVGSITCPTLRDISKISYYTYCMFLSCLKQKTDDYFEMIKEKGISIDENLIINSSKFDLIILDEYLRKIIINAFNFFFIEDVVFDNKNSDICTFNQDGNLIGVINKDNYTDVINVILQRVRSYSKLDDEEDILLKAKNKRGRKIFEKIYKERKKKQKTKVSKGDDGQTLPNIISSVSAFSNNTNYVQIWDLTVYQLYDLFDRLTLIDQYNISSTGVSVWGDEKNQFQFGLWNKNFYEKEQR